MNGMTPGAIAYHYGLGPTSLTALAQAHSKAGVFDLTPTARAAYDAIQQAFADNGQAGELNLEFAVLMAAAGLAVGAHARPNEPAWLGVIAAQRLCREDLSGLTHSWAGGYRGALSDLKGAISRNGYRGNVSTDAAITAARAGLALIGAPRVDANWQGLSHNLPNKRWGEPLW